MKTIIIIVLILIPFSCPKAQHLFPLHVGDKWVYWIYPNIHLESLVVNDTTMSNGKKYFNMKDDYYNHNYYRQQGDSVFIFYPSLPIKEYLIFDFSANVGDTITEFQDSEYDKLRIILTNKSKGNPFFPFFSQNTTNYTFYIDHTSEIDDGEAITITDSLGITSKYNSWYSELLSGAIINNIQYGNITDVKIPTEIPSNFYLAQNYPNPFNPTTTIKFSIPRSSFVSIKVYDILGRAIESIVNEEKSPGIYTVKFDGSTLTSGIYFYQLKAGNYTETKKFILIK